MVSRKLLLSLGACSALGSNTVETGSVENAKKAPEQKNTGTRSFRPPQGLGALNEDQQSDIVSKLMVRTLLEGGDVGPLNSRTSDPLRTKTLKKVVSQVMALQRIVRLGDELQARRAAEHAQVVAAAANSVISDPGSGLNPELLSNANGEEGSDFSAEVLEALRALKDQEREVDEVFEQQAETARILRRRAVLDAADEVLGDSELIDGDFESDPQLFDEVLHTLKELLEVVEDVDANLEAQEKERQLILQRRADLTTRVLEWNSDECPAGFDWSSASVEDMVAVCKELMSYTKASALQENLVQENDSDDASTGSSNGSVPKGRSSASNTPRSPSSAQGPSVPQSPSAPSSPSANKNPSTPRSPSSQSLASVARNPSSETVPQTSPLVLHRDARDMIATILVADALTNAQSQQGFEGAIQEYDFPESLVVEIMENLPTLGSLESAAQGYVKQRVENRRSKVRAEMVQFSGGDNYVSFDATGSEIQRELAEAGFVSVDLGDDTDKIRILTARALVLESDGKTPVKVDSPEMLSEIDLQMLKVLRTAPELLAPGAASLYLANRVMFMPARNHGDWDDEWLAALEAHKDEVEARTDVEGFIPSEVEVVIQKFTDFGSLMEAAKKTIWDYKYSRQSVNPVFTDPAITEDHIRVACDALHANQPEVPAKRNAAYYAFIEAHRTKTQA